ncbi:type VII secretion protein EccB [Nocardia brasiliensis]|uniref:Type VII secretion protein EccB n=1 Tax=Nocardia brasiliensis TaxID=37326 RepID=A0A6G9XN39_NOCBR|nr:type VII secretion protein EccB [Nocardia brasiliensis]QIS02308.1 type VII secretion protein EccB [Nocardia brasiliensis]
MPAQLTTRAQVNGYRFLLQRYGHAMVRRDVRMLHDPMRIQFRSLITGIVLAVLVTAGCAILSFLRPQGQVGDAKIVLGAGSGALYAVVDGTLHPALNLASARLIAGSAETPTSVKDDKLSALPRGPLLGIPGAPAALPGPAERDRSEWTLCEDISAGLRSTVLAGPARLDGQLRPAAPGEAVLVSNDGVTYLIYDGKHARVDKGNEAIVSAIPQLRALRPRPIGAGLLNASVAVPELAVPVIPRAGEPSAVRGADIPIGAVIRVQDVVGSTSYVVLAEGVQRISEFTARVLRTSNSMGLTVTPKLSPDAIKGIPVVDTLPVDQFPEDDLTVISADTDPVACVSWARAEGDHAARLRVLLGSRLPLAAGVEPMAFVASAGASAAYLPASTGEFVQATGIEPDSSRRDGLFYITDTGVRFGIPDAATAAVLGLTQPKSAPWQIISQLPAGPMLDRQSALIARDIVAAGQ